MPSAPLPYAARWMVITLLAGASPLAAEVSFNKQVRPLLSENCFSCHGPDTSKIKGDLRLDVRESALKPAKSGALAIVPGKPEESEILKRISSADADEVMPPPKEHKKITPAQSALLKQWISEGAKYEGHWAFIPPVRPSIPGGTSSTQLNPVDAFLRARLAKEGLSPAPEAPKETLARRVYLDLTGLPPTQEALQSYLRDETPQAYERMVDRAFSSPAYGERMAIQWLDFARYADSNGFQADYSRQQWPWRDWVINAFNQNTPFDRFTIEQIAGDLLPTPSRDQLVATGFHRNHRLNGEGGLIAEEWFVETVIDRVETTGSTWLALTLNCCRCHDHKYDPISQKEFYQLFSFFNSNDETGILGSGLAGRAGNTDPVIAIPNDEQQKRLDAFSDSLKQKETHLTAAKAATPAEQAAWEPIFKARLDENPQVWSQPVLEMAATVSGATVSAQEDGSFLITGKAADKDTLTLTYTLPEAGFTALQIESLNDAALPGNGPARGGKLGPILTALEAEISESGSKKKEKVKFAKAESNSAANGYPVKSAVGLEKGKGWAVDASNAQKPAKALFIPEKPVEGKGPHTLTIRLKQDNGGGATFGRVRVSISNKEKALVHLNPEKTLAPIQAALAVEPAKRTAAQKNALRAFFVAETDNSERRASDDLASVRMEQKTFADSIQTVMVMKEKAEPRQAFLLNRGEYDKKGDPVERGVPAVLPGLPKDSPENRLGLARWLVSEQNPLTARVWVNRAWERFFGMGIVKTTENFGVQADWPFHPELLDFLATEFMNPSILPSVNGTQAQRWDMKALQKLLVMSAAYRQSSKMTPELLERDPDNRLLARGPRFRLSGELLRDQALSVSGLLVDKIGGPSVRPYMPEGVWDETTRYGDLRGYKPDKGDGLYRRSLYTIWKRTAAPPSMLLFDAPTREICTVKRSRTNTPLQALSLLNEVTYVEAARVLAERMLREGGSSARDRISWAFQKVTCRAPQPDELQVLEKGLQARLARYQTSTEAATQLTSQGASTVAAGIAAPELAAYTLTANILLNLDETITRE